MKVYGMGERKTPNPFIVACDKFVYIEVIRAAGEKARAAERAQAEREKKEREKAEQARVESTKAQPKKSARKKAVPEPEPRTAQPEPKSSVEAEPPVPAAVVELLADSVEDIADEDGYAFMGDLGNLLVKKQPDFDPRNFGFSKLTKLVKALDRFEVDVRSTNMPHVKHIYVRDRERR